MDNIAIIGSLGHAKVVVDCIEKQGRYKIVGLISNEPANETVLGYSIIGTDDTLKDCIKKHNIKALIIAVGHNALREEIAEKTKTSCPETPFISTIHPSASIGKNVQIGEGSVILAGAVVNTSSTIGKFCILNTNSSLDHDSTMEDFSSLAPQSHTGGGCKIGKGSAIGIGASLIHNIEIGEHSVIGAGSTVLNHIESYKLAYGTPAKIIRKRIPSDKYL